MNQLKSSIFWDITPYSPLKVDRRFGGTCCLQGRRVNRTRNQRESRRGCVPTKLRFTFNGLHGIISQNVVRTSNPTNESDIYLKKYCTPLFLPPMFRGSTPPLHSTRQKCSSVSRVIRIFVFRSPKYSCLRSCLYPAIHSATSRRQVFV
jgi:hypothetical protein